MNAPKRFLVTLALVAGFSTLALSTHAADPAPAPQAAATVEMKEGKTKVKMADKLKQLSDALGLTEEQKTKIGPLLLEETTALGALYADKTLDGAAKKAKGLELRDSFSAKVRALLTPEQQAKFDLLPKGTGKGSLGGMSGDLRKDDKK